MLQYMQLRKLIDYGAKVVAMCDSSGYIEMKME